MTIGRPLMVMPRASASSRAPMTGGPTLLAPSPETSMTRRAPSMASSSSSTVAKLSAREIEVPRARLIGMAAISSARPAAAAGPSMTRQGTSAPVLRLARPFEIGDGDAAERAGGDGADEVGVAERREVAVALDGELGQVHGARGVDGEDDLGVDLDRLLGAREAGGEEEKGEESWERSKHAPSSSAFAGRGEG